MSKRQVWVVERIERGVFVRFAGVWMADDAERSATDAADRMHLSARTAGDVDTDYEAKLYIPEKP